MSLRERLESLRSLVAGRPIVRWALAALGVGALALLASAPTFNNAYWRIDEEQIVVRALGFLSGDLNPHWFGYHTLPMYLVAIPYLFLYALYGAFGWIASKAEFASLLFSDNAVFFVSARLTCAAFYTVGVVALSRIVLRDRGSLPLAAVFVFGAMTLPDAVEAATFVRVDGFLFAFMALTICFACYAEKTPRAFVLSLVFCAAAVASKIPALVLLPVLLTKLAWDTWRGLYPRRYLVLLPLLPPLLVFAFMPYSVLDFGTYRPLIDDVLSRVTGTTEHVGKIVHRDLAEQVLAPWRALARQLGIVPLLGAGAFIVWSCLKERRHVFPALFALAYVSAFSTSTIFDSYWLRPVYPWALLFFVLGASRAIDALSARIAARPGKLRVGGTAISSIGLVVLAGGVASMNADGLARYGRELTLRGEDTRVASARWLHANVPDGARVVLCGVWQQYLPFLPSSHKARTLKNSALDSYGAVKNSAILREGFDLYFAKNRARFRRWAVELQGNAKRPIAEGAWVVTTDWAYSRYFTDFVARDFPGEALAFRRYYDHIMSQPRVARFKGRGPQIDVYVMKTAYRPRKRRTAPGALRRRRGVPRPRSSWRAARASASAT